MYWEVEHKQRKSTSYQEKRRTIPVEWKTPRNRYPIHNKKLLNKLGEDRSKLRAWVFYCLNKIHMQLLNFLFILEHGTQDLWGWKSDISPNNLYTPPPFLKIFNSKTRTEINKRPQKQKKKKKKKKSSKTYQCSIQLLHLSILKWF